jgi:hypothetical protein
MKVTIKPVVLSSLFSFAVIFAHAQRMKPSLKDVPLQNLDAFQSPHGLWQVAGNVSAAYDDTVLTSTSGTGVLFNNYNRGTQFKTGYELKTKVEHGDMVLEADIMVPRGSNSGIYFQSRYEVQIYDSWRRPIPYPSDLGGIYERWKDGKGYEGKAPLVNAAFAPGLWQHLEVSFQAPRFDANGTKISPARFNYVKLNGITIHENIFVSGPTRSAAFEDEKPIGPLLIQGDHGQVALRNLKWALQNDMDVKVVDLSYKYFEKTAKTPEEASRVKPSSEGKANAIDVRVAPSKEEFFIRFDGKLSISAKDEYLFSMFPSGTASLEIDGKKLIPPARAWLNSQPLRGTMELDAGTHSISVWMHKDNPWEAAGLAVFAERWGYKAVPLHALPSIPEYTPAPLYTVKADKRTEIVRSFMMHKGKKLTHVLSVGDPSGLHYSYDLLQGGLLQAWRGDFLNTTDMWHERGEPQVAAPLGAPMVLAGSCPVFDETLVKDSVADYTYRGYTLSAAGAPRFKYIYRGLSIVDEIKPDEQGRGLTRTLTVEGGGFDKLQLRIAQASKISKIKSGLYSIDDGSYFIEVKSGTPDVGLYQDRQVLLMRGTNSITYQLIW